MSTARILGIRTVRLLAALLLVSGSLSAFAQEAPNGTEPTEEQVQDEPVTPPEPDAAPEVVDVVGQWGVAPNVGADADAALARRWFRDQNTERARWGVPTAARDPYLD